LTLDQWYLSGINRTTLAAKPMKRTWTIIGVADVAESFKWYQSLLGLAESAPAHDYFGQIVDSDGTVLLCLHEWGVHEHPSLTSPNHAKPGNGLLLFFRVDNFDLALQRARAQAGRRYSFDAPEGLELSDADEAPQPADAIDARGKRLGWDVYS
jgi:catechol 2,3-dioxygenase-like lactoylglutathione lyase family enzyme